MSVTSNCITENSKLHIQEMLLTPQISETVYSDVKKGKTYKLTRIRNDGSIYLGETSYEWWNNLFNLSKEISFETFCMRVYEAIAQMAGAEGSDTQKTIMRGLNKDILTALIATKDVNIVVDRLFDTLRFAIESSPMASKGTPLRRESAEDILNKLKFTGGADLPLYDSRGDILVTLYMEPTGYKVRHVDD